MRHAFSQDRRTLYVLPGSHLVGTDNAITVEGTQARTLAPELTCGYAHCTGRIHFSQGESIAPYWAHGPNGAGECSTMGGQPGEWHDFWQHNILPAPALRCLWAMPGLTQS